MDAIRTLAGILEVLPTLPEHHAHDERLYAFLQPLAREAVEQCFGEGGEAGTPFGPFGELRFPYVSMGTVDSLNLFDLDELILFAFYWARRSEYRRVADIGANIGLHSVLLDRCGYEVRAYEPDPRHFGILARNLELNESLRVEPIQAAVSDTRGEMEFVRVLGNTTGSHLAGAKPHPYGELERFPVALEAFQDILTWADLVKIDAEGHERTILSATPGALWERTDALVEVSSEANAEALFAHFRDEGVALFSQKRGWRRVERLAHMPTSYREGSLFISRKERMPWNNL